MIHKKTLVLALVAALGFAASAQAGSVSAMQVANGGISDVSGANLANTVTNDILIDTAAGELIGAIQIWLQLDAGTGTIFQHPFGANTPPNATQFGLVPALPFDTFVASGVPTNDFVPVIAGASADLGSPGTGGAAIFDADTLDATFGPQAGQATGGANDFLVARITLANTANGTFDLDAEFSSPNPRVRLDWVVTNGIISPGGPPPLPGIDVLGNGMSIGDGDTTPSLLDDTDFGNVAQGAVETRSFTINNTGTAQLDLGDPDVGMLGPFSVLGAFPDSIPAAGNAVVQVSLDTSVLGPKVGTLSFGTNVEGLATFNFDLAANVVPEPASFALVGLAMVGLVGVFRRRG
jgi:hypothetical protein